MIHFQREKYGFLICSWSSFEDTSESNMPFDKMEGQSKLRLQSLWENSFVGNRNVNGRIEQKLTFTLT